MTKGISGLVFLISLTILPSCIYYDGPPRLYIDPRAVPRFEVTGAVRVVNASPSMPTVVLSAAVFRLSVDYKAFTDLAVTALGRELEKKGAVVADQAAKSINLAIVEVKIATNPLDAKLTCVVDFSVETGDGYSRRHEVRSTNENFQTSVDEALSNVVPAVLQDQRIRAYLAG